MEQETKPKKNNKKRTLIIGALVTVVLVIAGISFVNSRKYESTDNAQLDGDIFSIRAGITAYAKELRFDDNQAVKKGDTLIIFDTDELKAKVQQAQAALDNANANLLISQNRASASEENAAASQKSAQSNQQSVAIAKSKLDKAQKDFDRVNELVKIKGATQEQADNAQSNLDVAKSEYARAVDQEQSSVSSSFGVKAQAKAEVNQIDLAKAQIRQREGDLVLAQKQLSYAYVIAPCDGIVTKRSFNQGQYITAGQSLCAVVNTEHYWISANFKETQLRKMKIGNEVEIELDAFPDMKITGKIESLGGATGAKFSLLPPDNATGNFIKITQRFPLRISVDNISAEDKTKIFPGLSAFVKVKVD